MLLDFQKSKELLEKYSIPVAPSEIFEDFGRAQNYAQKIGYPVVAKIWGDDVLHRSELGGVKINIKNADELEMAFKDLQAKAKQIMVQKMESGHQVSIGVKYDRQFGPVIMFGLGGIFVEILKDVSFRLCPVSKEEALAMIREIKGFAVLQGARGGEAADLEALASFLSKVSRLAENETNISEIDFNPVLAAKQAAIAVDFKILQ
ncbi:MAG: acetate--CoA ligase family protein [Candidatus Paceibacterota bacterium]